MTAFGRARGDLAEWEIKSVNHRYLELGFHLPDPLRHLEARLRDITTERIRRGRVDATLRFAQQAAPAPVVEETALRGLLEAVGDVRAALPDAAVNALEVLRWPGVLRDDAASLAPWREAALCGYRAALDDLLAHRRGEGANLAKVLREQLAGVERIGRQVRHQVDEHGPALFERLRTKAHDLPVRVDAARLEQEVALLAQRADVTEELDRVDIHLASARACLDGNEPCGRRLDFLMQELGREANTLAAKAALPETSRLAVDLKVVVERLREQVQNVE